MDLYEQLEMLRLKVMRWLTEEGRFRRHERERLPFPILRGDDGWPIGLASCVALIEQHGYLVQMNDDAGDARAHGWCDPFRRVIFLRPQAHRSNLARIALHEAAHAWAHQLDETAYCFETRQEAETIAEAAAWLAARRFQFDTSEHAVVYLGCLTQCESEAWGRRGTDVLRDRDVGDRIVEVAACMIDDIEATTDSRMLMAA
jgi:hypothetical protein